MPLVRVHEASDGQLFKSYDDYVAHEENIKFQENWDKAFNTTEHFDDEDQESLFKEFVYEHQDILIGVIGNSKVKRTGNNKKK